MALQVCNRANSKPKYPNHTTVWWNKTGWNDWVSIPSSTVLAFRVSTRRYGVPAPSCFQKNIVVIKNAAVITNDAVVTFNIKDVVGHFTKSYSVFIYALDSSNTSATIGGVLFSSPFVCVPLFYDDNSKSDG